jgi:hypothetical protein
MMSMTIDELYQRRGQQAALQAAAERDTVARRCHCGKAADLSGFEDVLAERLQEAIE